MRHELNLILPLRNLNANQKVILADLILNEEEFFVGKDCYTRLQMSKHTYNKQMRELVKRGLILRVNRVEYKLNINIF